LHFVNNAERTTHLLTRNGYCSFLDLDEVRVLPASDVVAPSDESFT